LFLLLLIIFIVIPIIEISLFIEIGSFIGSFNTILLIFTTALIGVYFVRQQGISTYSKLYNQLQNQEAPIQTMFEGLVILISGILLITPGFFTDALGFLGLIPLTRVIFIKIVANSVLSRYGMKNQSSDDGFIEGDFEEINDDEDKIK
jgi:UPF0716 protein FxsA